MSRTIRQNLGPFSAILVLILIAAIVGGYILENQRFRFPLAEDAPMRINVELDNAQAVTPGRGQTVQVAGVEIGDIGEVKLKDGRALVALDIKKEYDTLIRRDATAALRPRTGLKDMYVQVFPGKDRTPVKEGFTIPIANSLTDVDFDEILSELDARTRDYITLLANGAGEGLRGKGDDLARTLERYGPTVRDLGRVNREVAKERIALRRLVTSLAQINGELAERPQDLSRLVSTASTTLDAIAGEDDNLRDAVGELAPTLQTATATLNAVAPFADRPGGDPALRPPGRAARQGPRASSARPRADVPRTRPQRAGAQPLHEHARPQRGRPRGAGQGGPRRGLPVPARLDRAPDDEPAERRRRQRPDPPDLPDGHLLDADEPRQRRPAGRVRAGPLAAAGDRLQEPHDPLAERQARPARQRRMNTEGPTPGRIIVIAGFALTCFGLLLFLWLAFGGAIPLKPQGYRVQVAFTDAATLADQADVRTAGVRIGKVVEKELAPGGGKLLTTIELDAKYAPMKVDARAILRQKTLLGETYVEVTTGSRGAPDIEEGARLPDGQVRAAVEFDELFSIFDEDTRKAFRQWQASAARAGAGRGRDLNDALGNLPVFAENAEDVVSVLDSRREALRDLVRNTGRTFEQLTDDEQALTTFVQRNTELFDELAERREALADSIRILPTFLAETKTTLRRVRTFAVDTEPLIRDLDPVLEDLQPTLASLRRLSPDLENLFENVDPLISAGDEGLPALSRILRGLDPTLASTGPFLQQLNPLLRYLEFNQTKVSDFLGIPASALGGIRSAPAGSKSNGHVLPQVIMFGAESLPAPSNRSKTNRGNTYLRPDAARDGRTFMLPSFDCSNSREKGPTNTPGCRVQGQVPFEGESQRFPQVQPGLPGGRLRSSGG